MKDAEYSARGELRFIGVVEKAGEQEARARIFAESYAGLDGLEDLFNTVA